MHAALASGQIDICLIPEVYECNTVWAYIFLLSYTYTINVCTLKVPSSLHGPHGVLRHLKYLIDTKGSAVVCVAEGAGQVKFDGQTYESDLFPVYEDSRSLHTELLSY